MFLFFLLLLILPTALWYLTSAATITRWLWSRYPAWLDKLLYCTACSGFWWGNAISLAFSIVGKHPYPMYTAPVWGLVVLVTNPLVTALHSRALDSMHKSTPVADPTPPQFADVLTDLAGIINRPVM